jgi:hypothetical protein
LQWRRIKSAPVGVELDEGVHSGLAGNEVGRHQVVVAGHQVKRNDVVGGQQVRRQSFPGTNVLIFDIFPKKIEIGVFAKLCKSKNDNYVYWISRKNGNSFAANWRKSSKMAIVTLTRGVDFITLFLP